MAIDWGRMARGVATGYLSAKIANTEANDKLNADIHKAAGINFHTNTYPDWQKKERVREREFKQIADFFGSTDAAHYFGDKGGITGEGNSLDVILNTLKAKDLDPNKFTKEFKDFKWEGSTYAERKEERFLDIQDAGKIATDLSTGPSKIGPMTAKSQLEGTVTDKITPPGVDAGVVTDEARATVPGTPIVPDKPTIAEQQISKTTTTPLGLSDIFAPLAKKIDVETRYDQIEKAIQSQFGYAKGMQIEGDQVLLNWGNGNRKIHNAHLALSTMILKSKNIHQYDAAKEAKTHLNSLTVVPFMNLEKDLNGKYTEAMGGGIAKIGTGRIDVTTQLIDGVSLKSYIFEQIDLLPKNTSGRPDDALLARFIQNIPDNFRIGSGENAIKFKTEVENALKVDAALYKLS